MRRLGIVGSPNERKSTEIQFGPFHDFAVFFTLCSLRCCENCQDSMFLKLFVFLIVRFFNCVFFKCLFFLIVLKVARVPSPDLRQVTGQTALYASLQLEI